MSRLVDCQDTLTQIGFLLAQKEFPVFGNRMIRCEEESPGRIKSSHQTFVKPVIASSQSGKDRQRKMLHPRSLEVGQVGFLGQVRKGDTKRVGDLIAGRASLGQVGQIGRRILNG